jgi:hypothetical protein
MIGTAAPIWRRLVVARAHSVYCFRLLASGHRRGTHVRRTPRRHLVVQGVPGIRRDEYEDGPREGTTCPATRGGNVGRKEPATQQWIPAAGRTGQPSLRLIDQIRHEVTVSSNRISVNADPRRLGSTR